MENFAYVLNGWTLSVLKYTYFHYFIEAPGLYDATHIERCQDRAQIMLRDFVTSNYSEQPARFGKLLLLLPEIKKVSGKTLEDTLLKHFNNSFSFESFVNDLFQISR